MKNRSVAWALALSMAVGFQGPAQSPCGPSGLSLTAVGGRLGDPFSLTLTGTPSVSGVLGFDLAPGPVATPIGSICLGLSPALQTLPFTLSATGSTGIAGLVPPNPALAGLGVYAQAAAVDATQPGGFAVSNGVHPVLRAPRLFFIDVTSTPGAGAAYDCLTDSFGPVVPFPSSVKTAVAVPALGWVAMLLGNGSLMAFDAATGAVTLNQPYTTNLTADHAMAAAGTTLVVTESASGASPAAQATVKTFSLPSGAPGLTYLLPIAAWVQAIVTSPGAGHAYLVVGLQPPQPPATSILTVVVPVTLSNGAPQPPIALGSGPDLVHGLLVQNGIIYFLTAPQWGGTMGLNAIDTALNAPFFPNPVPLPFGGPNFGFPFLFNLGPGTLGPTLFVFDLVTSSLLQLSPQTLSYLAPSIPLPPAVLEMTLSNGGSEWLLTSCQNCFSGGCTGSAGCPPTPTLLSLNATTHLFSPVGPLPSGYVGALHVLPSATLNKAFWIGNGVVAPITTDPATTIGSAVPSPFNPQSTYVRLVID
jgi:hypothetical protein